MLRLAVVRSLVVCVALGVVVLPWTARADTDAGTPATGGLPLARASEAVRAWATVVWAPTRILAGPGNDYEYFFYVSVTKCGGGATDVSVRFEDERYPSDIACPTGKPDWGPGSLEPIAAGRTYTATAWATQSGPHPRTGRVQRWRLQMPKASSIAWVGCSESCRLRST